MRKIAKLLAVLLPLTIVFVLVSNGDDYRYGGGFGSPLLAPTWDL